MGKDPDLQGGLVDCLPPVCACIFGNAYWEVKKYQIVVILTTDSIIFGNT